MRGAVEKGGRGKWKITKERYYKNNLFNFPTRKQSEWICIIIKLEISKIKSGSRYSFLTRSLNTPDSAFPYSIEFPNLSICCNMFLYLFLVPHHTEKLTGVRLENSPLPP